MSDIDIYGAPNDYQKIEVDFEDLRGLYPHQKEMVEHIRGEVSKAVGISNRMMHPVFCTSPGSREMDRMVAAAGDISPAILGISYEAPSVLLQHSDALPADNARRDILIAEGMLDAMALAMEDTGDHQIICIDSFGRSGSWLRSMEMVTAWERGEVLPVTQTVHGPDHDGNTAQPKRFGNNKKLVDHRRKKAMAKSSKKRNKK